MKTLPLDMSKFRKMKADDNTTTFQHHEGHQITIAHKKLSSKFRDQLEKLPTVKPKEKNEVDHCRCDKTEGDNPACKKHADKKAVDYCKCDDRVGDNPDCTKHDPVKMANGGQVKRFAEGTPDTGDFESVDPNDLEAQNPKFQEQSPVPMPAQPRMAAPAPQAPAEPDFDPYAPSTPVGAANTAGTPESAYVGPQKPSMYDEDQAFQRDLNNGHIKPKTYHDMFASKQLPGKLSTIFGLLLGGAGAGLTHQPSAVLGMMKNEIDNDFEAQKQSKTNAQNFIRLSQAGAMNEATIRKMVQEGQMTEAQAEKVRQETAIEGDTLAQLRHNRAAVDVLAQLGKSLPPGSKEQQLHAQAMAMIYPTLDQHNSNLIGRADAAKQMLGGFGSGGTGQQNMDRALVMSGQDKLARYGQERRIEGVPGEANREVPQDTRERVQAMRVLDDKGKDVLDYVNKHSGSWIPSTRAVAAQKIEEMKNFYNDSIKGGALTEGRLGWYDEQFAKHPTDILAQLMGSSAKMKEMIQSNSRRRDLELKNLGFPVSRGSGQAADQTSHKEGATGSHNGRPTIFTGGKWKYK